jgi:hypothetical protein
MDQRRHKGATIGLVAVLVLILGLLGTCFCLLARTVGGAKQSVNATDAGALGAARAVLSVAVDTSKIVPEFQGLGVNVPSNGNPALPNPKLPAGAPDSVLGQYDILAYNRAAGAATLIALNALEEAKQGSPNSIDNANIVINSLRTFGNSLNQDILTSGALGAQTAKAFQSMATNNNVNMLGLGTSTKLVGNLQFKSLTTGDVGQGGKSNVYFNPVVFNNDSFYSLPTSAPAAESNSGSITSVALPDPRALAYETQPAFKGGEHFLKAYEPINLGRGLNDIYFAAVNPASTPHLVDTDRFNRALPQFGYAPVNAVAGNSATKETLKGPSFNGAITAFACAIVGAIYNEYPVSLPHGYIRIYNGPDALVANPVLSTGDPTRGILPVKDASVGGDLSIYNNELWMGAGGQGGIWLADNGVFGTNNSGALSIINAWIAYNNGVGPYPGGIPNPNIRTGPGLNQTATEADMRRIRSIVTLCTDMNTNPSWIGGSPQCIEALPTFGSNYGDGATGSPTPLPPGSQLTDVAAFKAELIEQWQNDEVNNFFPDRAAYSAYTYTTDGSEIARDSGSKYMPRDASYAVPTNAPSVDIGTLASPGLLMQQLADNGAACVDPSAKSPLWNDSSTIQGRLLQRCREILPSADAKMVSDLLFRTPIKLGTHEYIYLPANAASLTISTTPPDFVKGLPEYSNPGILAPDGVLMQSCADADYDPFGNEIDALLGKNGNIHGDNDLHGGPFMTFKGKMSTHDYMLFRPSCGKGNLLGEMSLYEHLSANGTFSGIN